MSSPYLILPKQKPIPDSESAISALKTEIANANTESTKAGEELEGLNNDAQKIKNYYKDPRDHIKTE